MKTKAKFKVGQQLFVTDQYRRGFHATITKVGTKYLECRRDDFEYAFVKGGSPTEGMKEAYFKDGIYRAYPSLLTAEAST